MEGLEVGRRGSAHIWYRRGKKIGAIFDERRKKTADRYISGPGLHDARVHCGYYSLNWFDKWGAQARPRKIGMRTTKEIK